MFAMIVAVTGSTQEFNLTLVHTGETFSQITAVDLLNSACVPINGTYRSAAGYDPCLGGFDRRVALIEQVRATSPNTLVVDAGYLFTGSLFWYLYNSTIMARYYDMAAYDAVKVDVYEFASGVGTLAYFVRHLNGTPVVAANLLNAANDSRLAGASIHAYAVITYAGGGRVGFASTLVSDIAPLFGDAYPLNSTTEVAGMLAAVGQLQNMGVNKIVASISSSLVLEEIIYSVPGIDVIVVPDVFYVNAAPGVTQLDFSAPTASYPQVYRVPWQQPVLAVGSGRFGKYVGVLNVTFDANGVIAAYAGNSIQLSNNTASDPNVYAHIVDDYASVQESMGIVVGRTRVPVQFEHNCLYGECAVGDWAAQVFRQLGGTQMGLCNGGSTAGGLAAGNVTLGQVVGSFPYVGQNELWTFDLRGDLVLTMLEQSVSMATETWVPVSAGTGRFLQVAGLNFTWNPHQPVGSRIVDVWIETLPGTWQLLDPTRNYSIATVDYTAKGGDGYTMIGHNATSVVNTKVFALDALLANLGATPVGGAAPAALDVTIDGRISNTSLTRTACFSTPDSSIICSANGYCYQGACVCTAVGARGPLCAMESGGDGGSTGGLSGGAIAGISIAVALPFLALLALVTATVLASFMWRRRPAQSDQEWTIDFDEIQLGDQLGQGGFGEVYRAKWRDSDVAVKMIPVEGLSAGIRSLVSAQFVEEARIMNRLRHPNIITFMAAATRAPRLAIVMEFMALGSLYDLIHNELVLDLPMQLRVKIMYQAAKGMHFLHSAGFVHRDLKSLNILLDAKWGAKVADFGLSRIRNATKSGADNHLFGSIAWTAPEVLDESPEIDYAMADVYSFGIVMWEVLTRRAPYEGLLPAQIAVSVLRDGARPFAPEWDIDAGDDAQGWTPVEGDYIALLKRCWDSDPKMRHAFLDILNALNAVLENHFDADDGRRQRARQRRHRQQSDNNVVLSYLSNTSDTTLSSLACDCGDDPGARFDHSGPQGAISVGRARPLGGRDTPRRNARHTDNDILTVGGPHPTTAVEGGLLADGANDAAVAGEPAWPSVGMPQRDVTYVVCDLADMDGLWEADPAGARALVAAFCEAATAAAETHCGHVFSRASQHSGGTFMIAFAQPHAGLGFAIDLFRGLAANNAQQSEPLIGRICVGIASVTGKALLNGGALAEYDAREYEDACLFCSVCQPGGVLGSPSLAPLLASDGVDMEPLSVCQDLGTHLLRLTALSSQKDKERLSGNGCTPAGQATAPEPSSSRCATFDNPVAFTGDSGRRRALGSSDCCLWMVAHWSDIALGHRLGKGPPGQTYAATWRNKHVAVKRLFRARHDDTFLLDVRYEAALLSQLDHEHVGRFVGLCLDGGVTLLTQIVGGASQHDTAGSPSPCTSFGDLLADRTVRGASWNERVRLLRDAAAGLAYLHGRGIVHGNLKPSNILVTHGDKRVHVVDYGFAALRRQTCTMTRSEPPMWMAPELFVKGARGPKKLSDIYAFGIIMWQTLSWRSLEAELGWSNGAAAVARNTLDGGRPRVPSSWPPPMADLVRQTWSPNPKQRPSAKAIVMALTNTLGDLTP